MMRKFIVGTLVALTLFVSSAKASDSEYITTGGPNDCSIYETYTFPNGDPTEMWRMCNSTSPKLTLNTANVYLGSSKLVDLLGAKLDTTSAFSGSYSDLTSKPSLFSGAYSDLTGKPTLFSGAYTDLTGKPSLATVATSGSYTDLTSKPTIPTNTNQLTNGSSFITASGAPVQSVNGLTGAVTISVPSNIATVYDGTTLRTNPVIVYKSASVSSGTAVFNITADGTSGGTALCANGPILSSVNPIVNDATAAYQMSWAWTNSNKTLTITSNKLTTANILTGVLGQSNANGATVNVAVTCY